MPSYRRNVMVGLTALGALIGLAAMLLAFGGTTIRLLKSGNQVDIQFVSDRADGLAQGAQVLYRGMAVGRVTQLQRDKDGVSVDIDAQIDNSPPLPANVTGVIKTTLISGIAAIELQLVGDGTATPQGQLVDKQKFTARFVGADLIPPRFAELAAELQKTSQEIRDARLVFHVGETIQGVEKYVNDPTLRTNIQTSLDNFRRISESVGRSADNVEKFSNCLDKVADEASGTLTDAHNTIRTTQAEVEKVSKQIDDRMLQVSKTLDSITAITAKVNAGQGTAGLLVNDPKLYQSLVDNSRELNSTIADLRRLVAQWEQEGVSLKLK